LKDKKQKIKLSIKEIRKRQQELCALGVLEEFKDYKINKKYLEEFLSAYSELHGKYGYVQEAIILPLFKIIKQKNPSISEEEAIKTAQRFFPIIRGMLDYEGVFKLIKKVSNRSDKEK